MPIDLSERMRFIKMYEDLAAQAHKVATLLALDASPSALAMIAHEADTLRDQAEQRFQEFAQEAGD